MSGGVVAGHVVSSRDEYAEQTVQQQTTLLGQAQQDVSSLTAIQSQFDVTGTSGLASALRMGCLPRFPHGQTPDSTVAQQNVIQQANSVASAFQQTVTGLQTVAQNTQTQLQATVSNINHLTQQLAGFNQQIMNGDRNDAGLRRADSFHSGAAFERWLHQRHPAGRRNMVGAVERPDAARHGEQGLRVSTVTVAPAATAPNPNAPPHLSVLSSDGTDLTADTTWASSDRS